MSDGASRRGFVFIEPNAHLTPAEVETFLNRLNNEIAHAETDREIEARDREIEAKKIYTTERNKLLLSDDCPLVGRSRSAGHVTVDEREAWIESRISDQVWIYRTAQVMTENAESYSWALKAQIKVVQLLGVFSRLTYQLTDRRYP